MFWPAFLYIIFGVCFVVLTLMMDLTVSANVFQASIEPVLNTPWSNRPFKTIYQVKSGPDVFQWITKAFLNRLYEDYPVPGDRQGYCTESFKCLLNEGDVDKEAHCAFGLVMGEANCPSYMATGTDCCESCTSDNCKAFNVPTKSAGATVATTQALNVSESCGDEMPGWLTELKQWARGENAISPPAAPGSSVSQVSFCPERQGKVSTNIESMVSESGRMLMVGQYNRALMARISLKRRQLIKHTSKAFSNAYPEKVNALALDPYKYKPHEENTMPFGLDTLYTYEEAKGFQGAGGFISFLDFDQSKEQVLSKLTRLQRNFWFDLNQGSLVLEMILFNGNVDRFVYVAFIFKHDFSGTTFVNVVVNALNLSLHDTKNPGTFVRFFLYLVIFILFVIFGKNEFEDMNADYTTYFKNPMQLLHLVSLVLVLVCMICYMQIVLSYSYINFELHQKDRNQQREDFEDLANLFDQMETFMMLQSMSLFLILFRCITLITNSFPTTGVIFNTFSRMRMYLVAFFVLFAVILLGFTFSAHYLFGTRIFEYQQLSDSFLACIRMLFRDSTRDTLRNGDANFGFIYFILFHLIFLIVQQLLISVLIYGYEKEKERIKTLMDSDRSPTRKLIKMITDYMRKKGNWLLRCIVQVRTIFMGGQGAGAVRANYERVGKLRDLRRTKPCVRHVVYEQKDEEEKEKKSENRESKDTIADDLHLVKDDPYYPNGMYHFCVDRVGDSGPAQEIGVTKDFRLVGIVRAGQKEDRSAFRDQKMQENGDGKWVDNKWVADEHFPKKFLEHLQELRPVTLIFEGTVKPLSYECATVLIFMIIFVAFAILVNRVEDSYSISAVHNSALKKPHWYSYNPTRITSLESVSGVNGLNSWITNAILEKEYECVTNVENAQDCRTSTLATLPRANWEMWGGAGVAPGSLPLNDNSVAQAYPNTPEGAQGLSLGYLPTVAPQNPGVLEVEIKKIVRAREYNVGVMPNNHVRLTFQVACFQRNQGERWKRGYPWILDDVFKVSGCSGEPCMQRMIKNAQTDNSDCFASNGDKRQVERIEGDWSKVNYTFMTKGTFKNLGGIAIGLGNTRYEAQKVIAFLVQDQLFKANAVSFVFELVSYNGNFDLFSYTSVMFDLEKTGKLNYQVVTAVFPIDVFSMGSTKQGVRYQTINKALFGLYIVTFLIFFFRFLWDLTIQYQITQALNKQTYMFLIDFFFEDWWNLVDLVSVFLNFLCIQTLLRFMMISGTIEVSRKGVQSWTDSYVFDRSVSKEDIDPFHEFQQAADLYQDFAGLVAVNGCILLIRFCKYFNGLSALRMVMNALKSSINELMIMMVSFLILMLSFAFMFYTRYAVQYSRFSTLGQTFINLFLFLNGSFHTEDLIANSPFYFLFVFVVFQAVFLLVMNMFLAAITSKWKEERKDAQEVSLLGAFRKLKESIMEIEQLKVLNKFGPTQQDEAKLRKLDKDFWQQNSALRHVTHLDETGRIQCQSAEEAERDTTNHRQGNNDEQEEATDDDEEGSQTENGTHKKMTREADEITRKLQRNFKKAHMEIASEMCRNLAAPRKDTGGGIGSALEEEESQGDAHKDDEEKEDIIGILDEPAKEEQANTIQTTLRRGLSEDTAVKEVWLDAIVTVLEEKGTLSKLQGFFRPPPMVKPTRPHEQTQYNEKKRKMEERLNLFLKWLQQEAEKKHLEYVKDMADDKEKNLKQQSLVLTDYLETLDNQIDKLETEIKDIEKNSARLRQHVSPLL